MDWVTTSTVLHDLRDFDNRAAWDRFVFRFRIPIFSFARKMGLKDTDAEDVVQETLSEFAKAYRAGRYDRDKGRLSTWLFGFAYRQTQNVRRKLARQGRQAAGRGDDTSFWAALPDENQASRSWEEEWQEALLEECLERVRMEVEPQTYRAFEMVVRDDKTAAQAADALGLPIKAVYNAKHRILKRIRQLKEEYERP